MDGVKSKRCLQLSGNELQQEEKDWSKHARLVSIQRDERTKKRIQMMSSSDADVEIR